MRLHEIQDREPRIYKGTITFYSGGARAMLTPEGDTFYMSHVVSDQRRQGHATKVVSKALAYADKDHKLVTLVAVPDDPEDTMRLIDFYKRFGFMLDDPSNTMMTRPAR